MGTASMGRDYPLCNTPDQEQTFGGYREGQLRHIVSDNNFATRAARHVISRRRTAPRSPHTAETAGAASARDARPSDGPFDWLGTGRRAS